MYMVLADPTSNVYARNIYILAPCNIVHIDICLLNLPYAVYALCKYIYGSGQLC